MRARYFLFVLFALVPVSLFLLRRSPEHFTEPRPFIPEAAPVCPWQNPEQLLREQFPGTTQVKVEDRILSGKLLEMRKQLGRQPEPEEMSLRAHLVYRDQERLGEVLPRRIKGPSGAIEFLVALDAHGAIRAIRIQRLREPTAVEESLLRTEWLAAFEGKHSAAEVPPSNGSENEAQARVRDGIRAALILHSLGEPGKHP